VREPFDRRVSLAAKAAAIRVEHLTRNSSHELTPNTPTYYEFQKILQDNCARFRAFLEKFFPRAIAARAAQRSSRRAGDSRRAANAEPTRRSANFENSRFSRGIPAVFVSRSAARFRADNCAAFIGAPLCVPRA
jgi:hypothetical protein